MANTYVSTMNFLFVLSLLAFKLAFAAEISEKNEENEVLANENEVLFNENEFLVNGNEVLPEGNENYSVINNFSSELWVEISCFLVIPQIELGFLNKAASNAVFNLYPYKKFVSNRFGIHELSNFECEKDLVWFKNLIKVRDPIEIFRSVVAGFFDQKAFRNSIVPISRYIMRVFRSFPAEVSASLNPGEWLVNYFVHILLETECYAEIIEIYKTFPRIIPHSTYGFDLEKMTKLVEHIFNVSEEYLNKSVSTFNLILEYISDEMELSKILYCCILANIPQRIYIHRIPDNFPQMLKCPFYGRHPKLSAEESERIYGSLLVILDRCRANQLETGVHDQESLMKIEEMHANHRLMFEIGFKPNIEENLYVTVIKPGNFDFETLRKLSIYALFSGRIELFTQIFNDNRLIQAEEERFFAQDRYYFANFVYGLHAWNQLPQEKRHAILTNNGSLHIFRFIYDAIRINFDENQILTIYFKRNIRNVSYLVPETFEYVYDTKTMLIDAHSILKCILYSNDHLDTDAFIKYFNSIVRCPYFFEALDLTRIKPLNPTFKMYKMFSQSQELYNLALDFGLKFYFDSQIMAELFKENIIGAKFVALERLELFQFLPLLLTRVQIENFESYMERSIADLFLIDALPEIKGFDPTYCYYKYRTLLHHLLNGPHRERLLGFDIPVFRRLLAREVNDRDALFLTEGLDAVVPPVNEGEALLLADVPQQNDP